MKKFFIISKESVIIGRAYKEWMIVPTDARTIFLNDWKESRVWSYKYE